nr:MAG TPA: hypothetical protein [Caudoviricetes sp.]
MEIVVAVVGRDAVARPDRHPVWVASIAIHCFRALQRGGLDQQFLAIACGGHHLLQRLNLVIRCNTHGQVVVHRTEMRRFQSVVVAIHRRFAFSGKLIANVDANRRILSPFRHHHFEVVHAVFNRLRLNIGQRGVGGDANFAQRGEHQIAFGREIHGHRLPWLNELFGAI